MRHFSSLIVLCLLWVSHLMVLASSEAGVKSRPNFIFIFIDDMGYSDLSCFGGEPGITPNIDALAKNGLRFSQFYVGAPICSPSRTAVVTGQNPARWRVTSFLAERGYNKRRGMVQWLDPNAPSLFRAFQKAGYATGHFGKWHLGGQRDVGEAPLITEYGFDESLTNFEGLGDRVLPLLDAYDGNPPKKYSLGSDNLGRGNIEWLDRSQVTAAFVDRSLKFIKEAEKNGKPFFVNVWPDDVHSPFYPPKELRGDNSKRQLYLGVLKNMDAQLAPLFEYINSSKTLRENTIILLASDNGPEPEAGLSTPFRGTKGMLYEGGIRSPLIVWGPGFIPKSVVGTVNDTSVLSTLDLFPSLTSIARIKHPEVAFDGENMANAFIGKSKATRTKPLYWSRPPDRPGENNDWPDLAVRDGKWKLLIMRDGSNAQLYNLEKDPGEKQNLAEKRPKVVKRLSGPLLEWWRSLPGSEVATATHQNSPKPAKSL